MKRSTRSCIGLAAFMLACVLVNSAVAQDKAKIRLDNDKVRVYENRQKPGQVNKPESTTNPRVIIVLKGSTIQRTYPDGKKESVIRKTGDVMFNQPGPGGYTNTNIGKNDYETYIVELK